MSGYWFALLLVVVVLLTILQLLRRPRLAAGHQGMGGGQAVHVVVDVARDRTGHAVLLQRTVHDGRDPARIGDEGAVERGDVGDVHRSMTPRDRGLGQLPFEHLHRDRKSVV